MGGSSFLHATYTLFSNFKSAFLTHDHFLSVLTTINPLSHYQKPLNEAPSDHHFSTACRNAPNFAFLRPTLIVVHPRHKNALTGLKMALNRIVAYRAPFGNLLAYLFAPYARARAWPPSRLYHHVWSGHQNFSKPAIQTRPKFRAPNFPAPEFQIRLFGRPEIFPAPKIQI